MTTRLLETGFETKYHALQVIFVRMLATAVAGSLGMWYKKVPGFPFGPREVRGLLALRGFAGTAGLIGLYCESIHVDKPVETPCSNNLAQIRYRTWPSLTQPSSLSSSLP